MSQEGLDLSTTEAKTAVTEFAFGVKSISISEKLPFKEDVAFLNVETLEEETFCVRITCQGFEIVSKLFDTDSKETSGSYETMNHLLNAKSPMYRNKFAEKLKDKLNAL